ALLHQGLTRRGVALATGVLCLAAAALWAFRQAPQPQPIAVAQLMSQLREAPELVPANSEYLLELAHRTAAVATAIKAHDPAQQRQDWVAYAEEMRRSAVVLADAVQDKDEQAMLLGARRLNNSCKQCHQVFRH